MKSRGLETRELLPQIEDWLHIGRERRAERCLEVSRILRGKTLPGKDGGEDFGAAWASKVAAAICAAEAFP